MAEAWTTTLTEPTWRRLGSTPEKSEIEVVLRSFDGTVLFATGSAPGEPDGTPVPVPAGSGARLTGLHFFAKPAAAQPCRILVRGV